MANPLELPRTIYENQAGDEEVAKESMSEGGITGWKVEKVEYGNGIQLHIEGGEYPQKGYAAPEAVWATNIVKRLLVRGVRLLNPLRSLRVIVETFTDIGWKVMAPYVLKRNYLTDFSRELGDFVFNFLFAYGLDNDTALKCGKIIAHLFEYDNVYRFTAEDLLSETSKESLLATPRREVKRLIGLLQEREVVVISGKIKLFGRLVGVALTLPKIRRAFNAALVQSEFRNFQFDNADRYWVCLRKDYNFMGLTYDQRQDVLLTHGYALPKSQKYKVA